MGAVRDALERDIVAALAPAALTIIDESEHHAGHAGAREGGESHFRVIVVSPLFSGLSRVERHRRVNAAASEAFAKGLHALAIIARAPGE